MKIRIQIIQDGDVVFEKSSAASNAPYLAELTAAAIEEFLEKHPDISLFNDDVLLRWSNGRSARSRYSTPKVNTGTRI